MQTKRLTFWLLSAVLLPLLMGCVYLRYLEVKNQLSEFEKYFVLEERQGLFLVFSRPVLLTQDIISVAKRRPTAIEQGAPGTRWLYFFLKQYPGQENEQGAFDIPVDLFFRDDRLYMGRLPEKFSQILSTPFIVEILKALGQAGIHPINRTIGGALFGKKERRREVPLPGMEEIVRLLGRPFAEEHREGLIHLSYLYRLQKTPEESHLPSHDAWARFSFRPQDRRLLMAEARFVGIKVTMSYERKH